VISSATAGDQIQSGIHTDRFQRLLNNVTSGTSLQIDRYSTV
jgi:hypothetical protein